MLEEQIAPLAELGLSEEQQARLQNVSRRYTRRLLALARDYQLVVSNEQRLAGRRAVRRAMVEGQSDKDQLRRVYQIAAGVTDDHKTELVRLKREMLALEAEAKEVCSEVLTEEQVAALGVQDNGRFDVTKLQAPSNETADAQVTLGIDPSAPPVNALIPDLNLADSQPAFANEVRDAFDVDELSGDTETYDMSLMSVDSELDILRSSQSAPRHVDESTVEIRAEETVEMQLDAAMSRAGKVAPVVEEPPIVEDTVAAASIAVTEPAQPVVVPSTTPVERRHDFRSQEDFAEIELRSVEELRDAIGCDEVRWAATSAPVSALSGDRRFLEFLAATQPDRIFAADLRTAVHWLNECLVDLGAVSRREAFLDLSTVNTAHPDGRAIVSAARHILARLNRANNDQITLDQIRGSVHAANAAGLETVAAQDTVFDQQADEERERMALFERLRPRIDQYFKQCSVVAFDQRISDQITAAGDQWSDVNWSDAEAIDQLLERASIAVPRSDETLRWDQPLNPFYTRELHQFRDQVLQPMLFSETHLSQRQWTEVKQKFAPSDDDKPLSADEKEAAALLEKLVLYQANMVDLANSFVSFAQLFQGTNRPWSEMGSLVIDGQRFSLAMPVDDQVAHQQAVRTSYVDLVYASADSETMALPILSGDLDKIEPGSAGLFEYADGRQTAATVTKIARNPAGGWAMLKSVTGGVWRFTQRVWQVLFVSHPASSGTSQPQLTLAGRSLRAMMRTFGGLLISALGGLVAFLAYLASYVEPLTLAMSAVLVLALILSPIITVGIRRRRRRSLKRLFEAAGWITNASLHVTPKMIERYDLRRTGHRLGDGM